MLRNRVFSTLIALGALSFFSVSALAQVAAGASPRDSKGRFIKTQVPKEALKKAGPARDAKGRFVKGGKMAATPKLAGKPVWDAKAKRWRLNGAYIKEADALKRGGKK